MFKPQQEYFECERFATDECPHRETHALKKREILLKEYFDVIESEDPDTFEEHNERKQVCGMCTKFVKKDP
ncbi:MAG: hypothetical protein MRK02_02680 [Candidatus Scalindua sp.]|nr:hypothetical protein [Candidatus Scalindua sp.]